MTMDDLNEWKYLNLEVEHYEKSLQEISGLRNSRWTMKHLYPLQREEYIAAVDGLEWIIQENLKKRRHELEKLQAFVDGIKDPFIYDLIRLKVLEGKTWEVMPAWMDRWGWYTPDGLKKALYRFLKKSEENSGAA